MKWIKDLIDGDHIVGQLLVTSCNKGTTDKGLAYLNITFQDKSGTIEAKKWDATDDDLRIILDGFLNGGVRHDFGTVVVK